MVSIKPCTWIRSVLIYCCIIFCAHKVSSQTVKNLPAPYYFPIDYDQESEREKFIVKLHPQKKPEFWLVVSDRDNNHLYNKAEGTEIVGTLKFKEYGYVLEDQGVWVKIGVGRREDNKLIQMRKSGWIKKKNLLLWPKSLVDENNSIAKKAFLLNKVGEIDRVLKEPNYKLVRVYDGPNSDNVIVDKSIYEVYFVYKREGTRVLLGCNNSINHTNVADYIIGWVDEYRIQRWNQRLALECNYDQENYDERKKNPEKHVVGFVGSDYAEKYSLTGKKDSILWDNDPVKLEPSLLAKSDKKRPIGEVFRFPVFTVGKNFIESGALAKIPTMKDGKQTGTFGIAPQIKLEEELRLLKQKKNRLNIYFMVEGTEDMQPYREAIVASISSLELKLPDEIAVRYGAMVYRDALLKKKGQDISINKLKSDKESVIKFINSQSFVSYAEDTDKWTNFRSALRELMIRGELSENEINVVIVIGANGDFAFNKARILTSEEEDCIVGEKRENLEKKLEDYGVNLSFLQVKNEKGITIDKFYDDARSLIVEIALKQEAKQTEVLGNYKITELVVPDMEEQDTEMDVKGVALGYFKRAPEGSVMTQSQILEGISYSVTTVVNRNNKAYETLFYLVAKGQSVESISDEFAPIIWDILRKLVEQKGMNLEAVDKMQYEKVKLYSKVYLPTIIPGLAQLYKTIVFMPAAELNDYIDQLGQMERAMNGPSDQKREEIYEVVVDLMQRLSGDKMTLNEINEASMDDLRRKMNGLEVEGFNMKNELGFKIEDLKNKKILNEEKLDNLGKRIVAKRKELKSIRDQGPNYDFSYTIYDNGNLSLYYWISTDKLF